MKARSWVGGLVVCLVALSCAYSPHDRIWVKDPYSDEYGGRTTERIGQQTFVVSAKTYDQVWDICEWALIRLGFPFYRAEKVVGEMVVRSERTAAVSTASGPETTALTKDPDASLPEKMYVSISKSGREVEVQVGFMYQTIDRKTPPPKRDSEWNRAYMKRVNMEVDRVVGHLKKALGS